MSAFFTDKIKIYQIIEFPEISHRKSSISLENHSMIFLLMLSLNQIQHEFLSSEFVSVRRYSWEMTCRARHSGARKLERPTSARSSTSLPKEGSSNHGIGSIGIFLSILKILLGIFSEYYSHCIGQQKVKTTFIKAIDHLLESLHILITIFLEFCSFKITQHIVWRL